MSGYLTPFINDNDKEPTWDGAVYIYKDKNCTKNKLKGRLPVQVKGKECKDLSKEEISYSMSVVDLNNYLDDGGAILFVVYIGNGGLCKKIYYIELPPIKLRVELNTAKGQKTKTLKLKEFPTDSNKKASIFLNCYENCRRQASFSSASLLTLDELQEQDVLEGITVPISTIGTEDPKLALLSSEVYVYANIKGSPIPQPLEMIPINMHTKETEPANISMGDKQFYSSLSRIKNAKQTKCIFGESFSITFTGSDMPCKSKNQNLLETAKEFSAWLCDFSEEELPYAVKELNRLQVIKRMRDFNIEEVREVYSIIEDTTSTDLIRAGAYLLLDQQTLAEIHFERLDDALKEEFKKYPIYHFWKAEETNNEQA